MSAENIQVPMWEDPSVVAYQCRAKGGKFLQPIRLGKGAPEGLTLGELNAELGKVGGAYVAFPLKNGGMVAHKRTGTAAVAK